MITIADDKQKLERLAALADGTRASIVEMLAGSPRTAGEIHGAFAIAAPAVSRHLRVLREAGLVADAGRPGDRRVRVYTLEREPLMEIARWLGTLGGSEWQQQLDAFAGFAAVRSEPKERRSRA